MPYRDILERLYVLDPLPGWKPTRNHIARLTEPPKHHLADPALATALLGLDSRRLLAGDEPAIAIPRDGTFLGALFESLVTQSVRVYAQAADATVSHLRTFAGEREIDLIVERGDGRVVAMEVKLHPVATGKDVTHLKWLREQMGDDLLDAVVVTTGSEAYRRPTASPSCRRRSSVAEGSDAVRLGNSITAEALAGVEIAANWRSTPIDGGAGTTNAGDERDTKDDSDSAAPDRRQSTRGHHERRQD